MQRRCVGLVAAEHLVRGGDIVRTPRRSGELSPPASMTCEREGRVRAPRLVAAASRAAAGSLAAISSMESIRELSRSSGSTSARGSDATRGAVVAVGSDESPLVRRDVRAGGPDAAAVDGRRGPLSMRSRGPPIEERWRA